MTVTKLHPCNAVGLTGFYTTVNLYFLDKAVVVLCTALIYWD